jgi:hypothetical protein
MHTHTHVYVGEEDPKKHQDESTPPQHIVMHKFILKYSLALNIRLQFYDLHLSGFDLRAQRINLRLTLAQFGLAACMQTSDALLKVDSTGPREWSAIAAKKPKKQNAHSNTQHRDVNKQI